MRLSLLACLCIAPAPALGQEAGSLLPQPPLSEFVAAFPRVAGTDAAAAAINARLQLMDDGAAEMTDCDLSREVRVALDSPAFLSLFARESGYCEGAAHPFFAEYGLTFDRATGAEVDWASLLPEALLQTGSETYDPNYPFATAALNAAYLAAVDPELAASDCREVYAMGLAFEFWMEAGQGLAMSPNSLPHAALACAEVVTLPVEFLKTAGMEAHVLTAIETGKATDLPASP